MISGQIISIYSLYAMVILCRNFTIQLQRISTDAGMPIQGQPCFCKYAVGVDQVTYSVSHSSLNIYPFPGRANVQVFEAELPGTAAGLCCASGQNTGLRLVKIFHLNFMLHGV
jgi:hypothetical protein